MSNENSLNTNGHTNAAESKSNHSSHRHSSSHHSSSYHHSSYSQPYGYGSTSKPRKWKKLNKEAKKYNRKKRPSMKKSNKIKLIIAIVICVLILLAIAAYEIYHAFILPNYVQPVLEEVVTVMQDERYTSGITREIQRLYDIGQLSGPEIEKYLEQHTGDNTGEAASNNTSPAPADNQSTLETDSDNNESSLGINSIKVIDENSEHGSNQVHYYSSTNKNNSQSSKPDNTVSMSELQTLSKDELYAKAKSIMSADDFATAMALKPKISLSKLKELRSDTDALMMYIQTTLTADEYSNMLYLYAKYSNHLTN